MPESKLRVAVHCFGCKLNQAEVESLCVDFVRAGCCLVPVGSEADIHIINTCTVTHVADRKARQQLRRLRRENPHSLLVVTGCYAERAPEEVQSIDNNVLVVGNLKKLNLVFVLQQQGYLQSGKLENHVFMSEIGRTRSFIRIQAGCEGKCSYCIVPKVRSGSYSRSPDEILQEIKTRVLSGYQEVVLTGTEIGAYNSAGLGLSELIKLVLKRSNLQRLRLSSLQPQHIDKSLVELWQDSRLCPHVHMPLQSGSPAVLGRMKRRYSINKYLDSLNLLRKNINDVSITSDLITGFPGETEDEFNQTLKACKMFGFSRIHVFPYSGRPFTSANDLPEQVMPAMIKKRERLLIKLGQELTSSFMAGFQGRVMPVLWEAKNDNVWSGLTANYIRIYLETDADIYNCITSVRLEKPYLDGFLAVLA